MYKYIPIKLKKNFNKAQVPRSSRKNKEPKYINLPILYIIIRHNLGTGWVNNNRVGNKRFERGHEKSFNKQFSFNFFTENLSPTNRMLFQAQDSAILNFFK